MKTLYLMRHAKSSWKHAELNDLERPLLEKGLKRTRLIIDFLKSNNVDIELIICSHATRSLETARIIAHAFGISNDNFRVEKAVYMADAESLTDQLYDLPSGVDKVMIVGHNPAITNLANNFLKEKIDYLPTSGVIAIAFSTDRWEELPGAKFKIKFSAFPKQIE